MSSRHLGFSLPQLGVGGVIVLNELLCLVVQLLDALLQSLRLSLSLGDGCFGDRVRICPHGMRTDNNQKE